MAPVLVTGGAGFIGANVADRLAGEGHRVRIYDALTRPGVEANLRWLRERHGEQIEFIHADIRDAERLTAAAADAQAVFHYAAQVAVTTSMVDPVADFATNIGGTLTLLEALRKRGDGTPLIFASTNKVYGDLADLDFALEDAAYVPVDAEVRAHGIGETRPLDFHTPYGVSKGAADQYVLDYARSFGVPTCVLRMSCIYGHRQMGTEDQGWVAHFLIRALEGEPITLYGDGYQVRDILDVSNAVDAYMQAWRRIDTVKGRAFNLGGGAANAVSLRQLLAHMARLIGREVDVRYADWRAGDQRYFVADTRAVGADVVQVNSPTLAAARFDQPVVAVAHGCVATWWEAAETGPLAPAFAWHAAMMRDGLLAADATVAPTRAYADAVRRRYALPRVPLAVHNGRTPMPLPPAPLAPHAFTAGRLWDRVKRTDLLDRVAALTPIRAAGPTIAPHGETVAAEHLTLLGTLTTAALARELAGRPVFVSAAVFEPFGLAVLEAAQAGCPLVLRDIATFRELWDGAALFVAGDDPLHWADAIETAKADRDTLGAAARARAERYTPEATAAAMAAIYARLLGRERAAA